MTQYVINIGAIPNDGTGDPLRTAFNETNLNFDQVFAAGPVLSNIQIANNKILTTNTNGNLILAPNGTGVVQANVSIVPNLANLRNLGSSTQRWATVYSQYLDISGTLSTGDLTVNGNLTVTGNTIQIGNIVTDTKTIQLANTAGTANAANGSGITVGANDNIATFLYTSAGNRWNTNIGLQVAGLANVFTLSVNQTANAWNIAGNTIIAPSGATWNSNPAFQDEYITSAVDGYINLTSLYANGNTASQIHLEHGLAQIVVDNGSEYIWAFDDAGNLTLPGNTFAVNYANGNPVNISSYGNANVATFLANFGSNTISTTGNITSNGVVNVNSLRVNQTANTWVIASNTISAPSGATWTSNAISKDEYITSATDGYINLTSLYANSNTASQVHLEHGLAQIIVDNGSEYIWAFDSTGNLSAPGNVSAVGNITGGNITTAGQVSTTGNITSNGLANVNSLRVNQTANAWVIAGNVITAPSGATWTSNAISKDEYITSAVDGYINLTSLYANGNTASQVHLEHGLAQIVVDNGSEYIWAFDDAGNLTLPRGGVVYETSIPGGTLSGNTIALKPSGGISTDQQLLIYPTVIPGSDDNHLHLTTGNLYNTELFLGDDNLYVKLANTGNVVINSNDNTGNSAQWTFGTSGNLTLPMGGVVYETNIPDGALSGSAIALKPTGGTNADQQLLIYPTVNDANHLHLTTGNLYNTELFLGDDNLYVKLANTGNVVINSNDDVGNSAQWTFGTSGNLTLPGNTFAVNYANGTAVSLGGNYGNANVATFLAAYGSNTLSTTGNITAGNLISSTGIVGNIELIMGNVANASATRTRILSDGAFSYIQTGNGTVGTTGNIVFSPYQSPTQRVVIDTASGNVTATGNVTAQNFTGNISITGNVQGTTSNVTLVAGAYSTVFDNTGNLTLPGNTFSVNYANNTPVDVVTRFESSWTVPVGNSTQSFTVTGNNSYQMWVEGNIPNGIIVWNATVSVTNTNVPVIGQQFAWNYEGGGNVLMLTSIPAQIIGTAGAIANAQPVFANTNVFSFGINNTSGGNATVRYGWIQIS
jgi:hypothetical protein